mmetsp:Transcript_42079/g.130339  ORF Transcript_42079/g.130339 Transcript_42079/m.130339 type:complete len:226 (+) Transcript_42079:2250-2927(+)
MKAICCSETFKSLPWGGCPLPMLALSQERPSPCSSPLPSPMWLAGAMAPACHRPGGLAVGAAVAAVGTGRAATAPTAGCVRGCTPRGKGPQLAFMATTVVPIADESVGLVAALHTCEAGSQAAAPATWPGCALEVCSVVSGRVAVIKVGLGAGAGTVAAVCAIGPTGLNTLGAGTMETGVVSAAATAGPECFVGTTRGAYTALDGAATGGALALHARSKVPAQAP